jgi:hypothetical protein
LPFKRSFFPRLADLIGSEGLGLSAGRRSPSGNRR